MVDRTVGNADDTPVFINSSSERSEVTCACCDKFKTELQKTLTELKSAQAIIELLQEEINMPNQTVSTDTRHLHHNENSTQLELKKGNWVHVPSLRQKRDSKPQVQYTLPVPTIANHYELLNNINQPMNTKLN
jgi:ATP phosphoribosyltransferase